ncbi:hydrogenase formation protein HypD [Butyrivibrio sp. MC2013]|uniref:hydrogenase formation protein HypD n=1 Tax=Butyrivibrio sp. MC2013 TaxID=1280686 RepID=UPI000417863F|nr:hydrogenase formation protein HypD [Butyrivibrio sp. MC2013]
MNIGDIAEYLKNYDGPDMNIMEVCGSHTGAIAKNGIPGMLSPKIHLISGPGCPVCVTTSAYVDRLIELSKDPHNCIITFGDLIRVPGSGESLSIAAGKGARVKMVYSPMDILDLARNDKDSNYIFAAVGFETTMPVYALMMQAVMEEGIENVRLLTALKTMPEVIGWLMENDAPVDGFLAPGHVSVVTGSNCFDKIAARYSIPFGVAGFTARQILVALCGIVKARGEGKVINFYPSVVNPDGNEKALALIDKYFEKADAAWRGIGVVKGSGRVLRKEYSRFDAGSYDLTGDAKINKACCCDRVLMGRLRPYECPLFGTVCTPTSPQGACMVSTEGGCYSYYANNRRD